MKRVVAVFLATMVVAATRLIVAAGSVPVGKAEDVGLSTERLKRISEAVDRHIKAGNVAGAVTLVSDLAPASLARVPSNLVAQAAAEAENTPGRAHGGGFAGVVSAAVSSVGFSATPGSTGLIEGFEPQLPPRRLRESAGSVRRVSGRPRLIERRTCRRRGTPRCPARSRGIRGTRGRHPGARSRARRARVP